MSCVNACFSIIQGGIYLYRESGSLVRTWWLSPPHSVAQKYALMAHLICNNQHHPPALGILYRDALLLPV